MTCFSQNSVVILRGTYGKCWGAVFNRGGIGSSCQSPVNFPTKMALCEMSMCISTAHRSRCGAMFILRCLAQPFRHFGPVRSPSLWRCTHFHGCAETLTRRSLLESLRRDLVQRALIAISCTEILPRDLLQRSCHKGSYRQLVQRSLQESCLETSYRVSCTQVLPGHRFWRSCTETLPRDLLERSCQALSYINLAKRVFFYRACTKI